MSALISTSLGAEGIPASNGENIIIGDTPSEFAAGIINLIQNKELMEKIRRNGRRLVEEKYAWEKGVEVLEGILEQMMTKPPSIR